MYYHFCLLCMFRPFIGQISTVYNNQPHEICIQAVQSLLALAQAYDDLFTLKRVPGLMPYFVCTSGLFALGMDESGASIDPVHLRAGNDASQPFNSKIIGDKSSDIRHGNPNRSPYIQLSAVTHARLLLAKMGSSHPAAALAQRILLHEETLERQSPLLT